MSRRSLKEITGLIEQLEEEKRQLEAEEFMRKFEPLKDTLINTTLTVAQIKKVIKDAEAAKAKGRDVKVTKAVAKPKKTAVKSENKTTKNVKAKTTKDVKAKKPETKTSKPRGKSGYEKEHACNVCGKKFIAHSPRQITCPECKAAEKIAKTKELVTTEVNNNKK